MVLTASAKYPEVPSDVAHKHKTLFFLNDIKDHPIFEVLIY